MRHRKNYSNLNRFTSWRKATIKSLLRALILKQAIRTTKQKAKLAQPYAERLIGIAKRGDLTARRYAFDVLGEHRLVQRLFTQLAPLFANRNSGYTRIISLDVARRGDGAHLVLFELTEKKAELPKVKPAKEKVSEKPKEEVKKPPEISKPHIKEVVEKKEEKVVERKPEKELKPKKKFLGGIRNIFKKERDSL